METHLFEDTGEEVSSPPPMEALGVVSDVFIRMVVKIPYCTDDHRLWRLSLESKHIRAMHVHFPPLPLLRYDPWAQVSPTDYLDYSSLTSCTMNCSKLLPQPLIQLIQALACIDAGLENLSSVKQVLGLSYAHCAECPSLTLTHQAQLSFSTGRR